MAGKSFTLKLSAEQQKQIYDALGKSISELNISVSSTGGLGEKDLDNVTGGAIDAYLYFPETKG